MRKLIFIATLFIFCIGLYCLANNQPDNDIWARLIAGKYIVENLALPKQDFLSYTPTHLWYDHEWGASVIFYLVLKYFGLNGLILLKGILVFLIMFFCLKTIEIRQPKASSAYNILYYAIMVIVASSAIGRIIRCLLFTYLFFSIFIYILERYRHKGGKSLIWLPFLMILWSNIHGGCISGFGILAIYIVGEFLNKKPVKPYIFTLIACFMALFINPYGIEYVKFLFSAALMHRNNITEWHSPFNKHYLKSCLEYKFYLICMWIIQIASLVKNKINHEKTDKTKILLIITMTFLSLMYLRHIPFFVLTSGIFLYDDFYSLINELRTNNEDFNKSICLFKEILVYTFIVIILLPAILWKKKEIRITETEYPRFAVEFIKINNITGNLFINFDWGSYAAYKLYPNNLIVMDGRYEEVYNPELLIDLKKFHLKKGDWYKVIREYKTDVMIIEKKYPVYKEILNNPNWEIVFENNLSGVFLPKDRVKEEYRYPIPNDEYYNKNIFEDGNNLW